MDEWTIMHRIDILCLFVHVHLSTPSTKSTSSIVHLYVDKDKKKAGPLRKPAFYRILSRKRLQLVNDQALFFSNWILDEIRAYLNFRT